MADKRDCYEVLGIQKGTDEDTIKKAYRTMAKKYHPDLHPGDAEAEAKFKEVNEAYSILSDPQKKAAYDQYGHAAFEQGGMGGGSGFGGFSGGFGDFGDLGDIFGDIFGGAFGGSRSRSRNSARRGDDIGVRADITFEEAFFGVKKDIRFNRVASCPNCSGTGSKSGVTETCRTCGGSGQKTVTQRLGGMAFQSTAACDACRGTGKIIKEPCPNCRGNGRIKQSKELNVSIPAGIDTGNCLTLRNEGNCGTNGGPNGDLIIEINIRNHPVFTREGSMIFCDVPITIADAVLGAEIDIPTMEGTKKYKIPEGTQSGTQFTMKGCGMPVINSSRRGDLSFTVNVEIPRSLTNQQKEKMKEFAAACGDSNFPRLSSFLKKLRDLKNNR